MSADPSVNTERFTVRSYELDARARLQISALLCYLQETAGLDTLRRGFSGTDLLARQQTWVLSRLALEVEARPGWRDEVVVRTWAAGYQGRLLARRDFIVEDGAGRALARAATAWLYIDVASRRPRRVDQGLLHQFPQRDLHAIDRPLDKLPALEEVGQGHPFSVRYSDLDINQHVNNSRYLDYVVSGLPAPVRDQRELAALELNFLSEARLGDQLETRCLAVDLDRYQHGVFRPADGRELVRAATRWRSA